MPALLMRTSRVSTWSAARWICETLVTSSVRGVTLSSVFCSVPRVPAYILFAPRLSASLTSARPMPRLAPVIKTVLFLMFIPFSFRSLSFLFTGYYARHTGQDTSTRKIFALRYLGFPKWHVSPHVPAVPFCPAAHAWEPVSASCSVGKEHRDRCRDHREDSSRHP